MSTITGARYAGATLTVDLGAIRTNYRLLRSRLGATACAAVVIADAYGLGAAAVAPALAAEAGQLQLNAMEPVLIFNVLQSMRMLTRAMAVLTDRCVAGIEATPPAARR